MEFLITFSTPDSSLYCDLNSNISSLICPLNLNFHVRFKIIELSSNFIFILGKSLGGFDFLLPPWHIFFIVRELLEAYPIISFLLRKPGGLQWIALAWGDLEPSYACVNFFPPISSVSWWQAGSWWGSV